MTSKSYEVGRGKPPQRTQFAKGQSGNPAGRPKGAQGVRQTIADEFSKQISLTEGGKRVSKPAAAALAQVLILKALQGDVKTGLSLLGMGLQLGGPDTDAELDIDEPEDAEIIKAALRRRKGEGDDE